MYALPGFVHLILVKETIMGMNDVEVASTFRDGTFSLFSIKYRTSRLSDMMVHRHHDTYWLDVRHTLVNFSNIATFRHKRCKKFL